MCGRERGDADADAERRDGGEEPAPGAAGEAGVQHRLDEKRPHRRQQHSRADAGDAGQRDSLAGEQEGQRRPHEAQHEAEGKDGKTAHPGRGCRSCGIIGSDGKYLKLHLWKAYTDGAGGVILSAWPRLPNPT